MTDDEQSVPDRPGQVLPVEQMPAQTARDSVAFREIAWILSTGAILIYLLALPIRIQYWRVNFEAGAFQELRRWMLVRDVWAFQFRNMPSFGSEIFVQFLFVVSALIILFGVILGLRLILLQEDDLPSSDSINAG